MKCKCGYNFAKEMLAVARGASQRSDSHAVIADKDYRKFLKSEIKACTAKSKKKRLKAIGKSSRFVGRMYECPECARLVLSLPERDETEFYVRED